MTSISANSVKELTWRGLVLACVLTVLFTAANVYLGLKVGMTFATSIPAAVISMAILRTFRDSNILENNIVQTIASSAGTISAVVFILPALVMIGFWKGFPFWQTFLLCSIGGVLGVMFTIPLRRALVVDSDLPYPEGTAAAETLKVGSRQREGTQANIGSPIADITIGTVLSFLFGLFSSGFKLLSDGISYYGKLGNIYTGTGFQLSFALIGAGYLIGIRVAIALLIGTVISWVFAVPILAGHLLAHSQTASDYVMSIWATKVRYIGAGTIGISALWAILVLLKPVYLGFKSSLASMRKYSQGGASAVPLHERDIPIVWVLVISLFLGLPLMALFGKFIADYNVNYNAGFVIALVVSCAFVALLMGFLVAAVSGYMAGLVGSSNSPISGIGILAIIVVSLFLSYIFNNVTTVDHVVHTKFIIALAIFTTSAIFSAACISNDNLQDLNTGHLVGATPWKQQIALIFGVVVGSLVLTPVLNILYHAYGFVGALPDPGMDPKHALSAPQATLMIAIAKGIISHHMHWNMILLGVVIGIVFLLLNGMILNRKALHLSVLSIGIAIYLPPEINIPLILGGILNYIVKRRLKKGKSRVYTERCGTLFASGLIVGSSIFGIVLAVLIGIVENQSPLALVGNHFVATANILGVVVFALICIYFVRYVLKTQIKVKQQLNKGGS